ncbi:MAG TPA: ribonuclease P protein component [Candidatus Dormibacteraeota bacterium]|nr:ribonuclease P protein component [Candidatus Dormibacteraeota bacterium]
MGAKFSPRVVRKDAIALRPSRPGPGPRGDTEPSLRFPRGVRLVRRVEYEAVYRGGQRRSSGQFVIFIRANHLAHSRFGISVKKALGGAVVRNRIRRRIREILRQNFPEIPTGWDIVIHPRSSVARAEFSALTGELLRLMQSIK